MLLQWVLQNPRSVAKLMGAWLRKGAESTVYSWDGFVHEEASTNNKIPLFCRQNFTNTLGGYGWSKFTRDGQCLDPVKRQEDSPGYCWGKCTKIQPHNPGMDARIKWIRYVVLVARKLLKIGKCLLSEHGLRTLVPPATLQRICLFNHTNMLSRWPHLVEQDR